MYAVTPGDTALDADLLDLLKDELNVKAVAFLGSAEGLVRLVAKPNFRALGPRFQKRSEEAAGAIRSLSTQALAAFRNGEEVRIEVAGDLFTLGEEELEILEEAKEGLVVQSDGDFTAALDATLDGDLLREGLARELVNRIQRFRKDSGLAITDRIVLGISGPEEVVGAAEAYREFITGETLATEYHLGETGSPLLFEAQKEVDLDGLPVRIALSRIGG
jgi:isoleucyl-tRNA synthetase